MVTDLWQLLQSNITVSLPVKSDRLPITHPLAQSDSDVFQWPPVKFETVKRNDLTKNE